MSKNMESPAPVKKRHTAIIILGIISPFILIVIVIGIWAVAQANQNYKEEQAEQARLAADPITISGVYNALNAERAKVGAPALTTLPNLTTGANQLCEDMRVNNYFDYKNPTTGKDANSYIVDNKGDLYLKTYVSSIFSGDTVNQTAKDIVAAAITNQATNLNDPKFNSVGWAVCDPPQPSDTAAVITPTQKFVVGLLAEKADPPVQPTTIYQPVYQAPARTSISCNSYEFLGSIRTNCF